MSLTTKKKPIAAPKGSKGKLSESRDLITTGRKDVTASKRNHGKRDENGKRPTTSKALVIRNGKYGAHGSGEIILASKMSGREKLDLLAENYTENSKKAVLRPFKLDECLTIADSQYNACLDEISALRDPDLFITKILTEARARAPVKDGKRVTPNLSDTKLMANVITTRIHNAYMLASAWSIILGTLGELKLDGLGDRTAQADLRRDEYLRSRYLVLYDMVSKLADIGQNKFAVLATTTPHYAQYFRPAPGTDPDDPEQVFDRDALKAACRSFLDSIILELSFPEAPYPKAVLYQILHEAVDESPREAKRFPQELWDAVGDLSVTVELQELLEGPLLGPGAAGWKEQPREMPEEYEKWVDAQFISEEASKHVENFQDVIKPITKTKQKSVLDTMWKCININYSSVSGGEDIDTLWQLNGALERAPQWHSISIPREDGEYSDSASGPLAVSKGSKRKKKVLALTNGDDDDDSHGSMPGLQSVSDSSDSEPETDSEDEDNDNSSDEDSDAGYDTDEEDELRELIRESMDAAMENPEFFTPGSNRKDFKEFYDLAEERKGNPFLKLLGSLRGRAFNSSPKLKTKTERTAPRRGFPFRKSAPTSPPPKLAKQAVPTASPKAETTGLKNQKATVEEVEDEDAAPEGGKKKKKKKKNKKKKASSIADDITALEAEGISPPTSPVVSSAAPVSPPTSPSSKKQVPKSPPARTSFSSSTTTLAGPGASTLSLPIEQTVAQSGHSYSKELEGPKEKIKSRPAHATSFISGVTEKISGAFSKFTRKDKHVAEPLSRADKAAWFASLPKRSNKLMHQLLNTSESDTLGKAPMKWDKFVQVMKDMGFTYVPSTAGSSVRFEPPSPKDPSVTFHKPHPDSTIHPIMLKEFGKKLMDYYGWEREDLMRASAH